MHAIEQAREYIRKLEAKVPPHLSAGGQRRDALRQLREHALRGRGESRGQSQKGRVGRAPVECQFAD